MLHEGVQQAEFKKNYHQALNEFNMKIMTVSKDSKATAIEVEEVQNKIEKVADIYEKKEVVAKL